MTEPTEREREKARALLSSFGLHPRTCGSAKAAAICDRLAQALADARAEERELCAQKAERHVVRFGEALDAPKLIASRIRALIGDANG